jgi:hypothetical protein
VVLAALLVLLGVVALSDDNPTPTNDAGRATSAPTTTFSLPTVATTLATTTAPPTTVEKVVVPKLVGMRLARAKDSLADRGLTAKVTYKSTARYPAGTVISQSRKAGADVLPDTTVSLVVAKALPPPPSTAPPEPTPTAPARDCHPSYPDDCIPAPPPDLDCPDIRAILGHGNITVDHAYGDPHGLDGNDNDGLGCE